MPFFSIIIPTYNRAELLPHALDSVRKQSFKDFEVLIIDDGSSDDTETLVKNYIQIHKLASWKYHYTANVERGAARNIGISLAEGTFLTFLDSDDTIYNHHLASVHAFIQRTPDLKMLHSAYEIGTAQLKQKVPYKNSVSLNKQLLHGNIMSCFGVFISAEILKSTKFCELRELSGSEDWLLWLKLSVNNTIHFQSAITGCLINHKKRSVLHFDKSQLEKRSEVLYRELKSDSQFVKKFGLRQAEKIYAHMLSYSALHLVLSKQKQAGIGLLGRALATNFGEAFSMRTLAILKHLF